MPVFLHQKQMYMLMKRPHTLRNYKKKEEKSRNKIPRLRENAMFSTFFLQRTVFLRAKFPTNLTKVLQLFTSMK